MAQEALVVEALVGQARNPVHGQADKGLLPYRVYNLVPDRMGGYVPYGRRVAVTDVNDDPLVLENIESLVGADETGVSSFTTGAGLAQLYWGREVFTQHEPSGPFAHFQEAVHLDGAGFYVDRRNFMVLEQKHPDRDYRIPVQPISSSVTAGSSPGSPLVNEEHGLGGIVEVGFGAGVFIAISQRGIHRRQADGSWETVYTESDSSRGHFQRVSYGGGTWMVAQGGGDNQNGRVLRSSDQGSNWEAVQLGHRGRITFIEYGAPSGWRLGVWWRPSPSTSASATLLSTNGGATWSTVPLGDGGAVLADAVSIGDARNLFVIREHPATSPLADAYIMSAQDTTQYVYWRWVTQPGETLLHRDPARTERQAVRVARGSDGRLLVVSRDGRVTRTVGPVEKRPGSIAATLQVVFTKSLGFSAEGSVRVRDLAYDPVNNAFIAVGDAGASEPRVWRSTNTGDSWERVTEVEAAFSEPITTVAVNGSGDALYMSGARWAMGGTQRGFESGSYNVYAVSYFNTHAGRFVYDLTREAVSLGPGDSVSFTATSKASIIGGSPWIRDSGGRYDAVVDDLRFDVYLQRGSREVEGQEVTHTTRYAFTESFPDSDAPLGRVIDAMPLGRQLVSEGNPTTVVFEKSLTALHQGRVWGMASQDEDRWHAGDGISTEIANQANRFVLAYTEIGWANLASDRNFIPLQPTQSSEFTGILSTPSGLLVMFENEIFLVTGDPAFGNLNVELYLDMVGCDPGTRPAKVGGVPFVIWNGKVWVLRAGQAEQLGAEQWLKADPFVRIVPEPQTRSILALTKFRGDWGGGGIGVASVGIAEGEGSGQVFRYMLDDQFWLTDPVTRDGRKVIEMLPACTCVSGLNTRFVLEADEYWENFGAVFATRVDGEPDTPHVVYRDIDFGAPERRSSLYLVKVGVEGPVALSVYNRNSPYFDADAVPSLFFGAANASNGVTWESVLADPGGVIAQRPRSGARESGSLHWRLPLRRTRGTSIDVRLELRGFTYDDALKLPMRLYYASGGEVR